MSTDNLHPSPRAPDDLRRVPRKRELTVVIWVTLASATVIVTFALALAYNLFG